MRSGGRSTPEELPDTSRGPPLPRRAADTEPGIPPHRGQGRLRDQQQLRVPAVKAPTTTSGRPNPSRGIHHGHSSRRWAFGAAGRLILGRPAHPRPIDPHSGGRRSGFYRTCPRPSASSWFSVPCSSNSSTTSSFTPSGDLVLQTQAAHVAVWASASSSRSASWALRTRPLATRLKPSARRSSSPSGARRGSSRGGVGGSYRTGTPPTKTAPTSSSGGRCGCPR